MSVQTGQLADEGRCLRDSGLTDEIGFLTARARMVILDLVDERLQAFGLKRHAYATLSLACTEYGPTQRELAAFLKLDPSRMVAILDELEERGLVVRELDPLDRRSRTIRATEEGRRLREHAAVAVRGVDDMLTGTMSNEERGLLVNLLRHIAFLPSDR